MVTLVYDIECYKNLFYVVTKNIETNEYKNYTLKDNLLEDIIFNPHVTLIGWNNHSYDDMLLNYIGQQSIPAESGWAAQVTTAPTTKLIWDLSNQIIQAPRGELSPYLKQLKYGDKYYKSIDIKALLDPLPGLKKMELRTNYKNVQDLPVAPEKKLTKQEKQVIKTYCVNDVDATHEIYKNHALTHIALRDFLANKFKIPVDYLRSASEPRTAESILTKEATRFTKKKAWQIRDKLPAVNEIHITNCIPQWVKFQTPNLTNQLSELRKLILPVNPETGYAIGTDLKRIIKVRNKNYQLGIGGLHSIDKPGQWASSSEYQLIDADVTSYYPSILLRDNLHPRGYDIQWSFAYDTIYHDRLAAKQDPNRETEAHALKIILNSTFGKLGSQYSSFYDPTLLLRITITGQLALLMLIEMCYMADIEVLSANTDGILVKLRTNQQAAWTSICEHWETQTVMNLEYTYYKRYARRDVNSYTALTDNNKIKNKGVFNPPDIRHDTQAPFIQKAARAKLLYDITPEAYLASHKDELSIHDFIFHFGATKTFDVFLINKNARQQSLSKSNRWYVHNPPIIKSVANKLKNDVLPETQLFKFGGKNKSWIKIPNGSNITLCNSLDNDSIPDDIDYDYYLEKVNSLIGACT